MNRTLKVEFFSQHGTIVGKDLPESMHKHSDVSHYYAGIHHS